MINISLLFKGFGFYLFVKGKGKETSRGVGEEHIGGEIWNKIKKEPKRWKEKERGRDGRKQMVPKKEERRDPPKHRNQLICLSTSSVAFKGNQFLLHSSIFFIRLFFNIFSLHVIQQFICLYQLWIDNTYYMQFISILHLAYHFSMLF